MPLRTVHDTPLMAPRLVGLCSHLLTSPLSSTYLLPRVCFLDQKNRHHLGCWKRRLAACLNLLSPNLPLNNIPRSFLGALQFEKNSLTYGLSHDVGLFSLVTVGKEVKMGQQTDSSESATSPHQPRGECRFSTMFTSSWPQWFLSPVPISIFKSVGNSLDRESCVRIKI